MSFAAALATGEVTGLANVTITQQNTDPDSTVENGETINTKVHGANETNAFHLATTGTY
jgi:hypothetical protein